MVIHIFFFNLCAAGAGFDYLIMDSALNGYLPLYLTPVLYLL